jgi:hypothetical protein
LPEKFPQIPLKIFGKEPPATKLSKCWLSGIKNQQGILGIRVAIWG